MFGELFSRPGEGQHASNLAHTHLRVHNQRGVMLLDGVKPQTPLYALDQENSAGYPGLSMTPIYERLSQRGPQQRPRPRRPYRR